MPAIQRYNKVASVFINKFGQKAFKVSLESGLGCPNRDGTLGTSGCVFCNEKSYLPVKEISQTLSDGIEYVRRRHGAKKFISYFQAGTNTYAKADELEPIFRAAIDHPDVVGLAIATRPDCLTKEHVNLLSQFSKQTMLWVELGLQSALEKTLKLIQRGHTVQDFSNAVRLLKAENISVVAHVILGLPDESIEDMLTTARFLNNETVDGVKIHNLNVLRGTTLEKWHAQGKINIPDLSTYAGWVVNFLEQLNPDIVIHRVNAHAPRRLTIAPDWSINKLGIFGAVEKELVRRNTWQGKKFIASPES